MASIPVIFSPVGTPSILKRNEGAELPNDPYYQYVSGLWHFENNSLDSGPLSLVSLVSGSVSFTTAHHAPITGSVYGVQFAGTGKISSSNNNAFNFAGGQPFQIQCWFNTTNGADQYLFGQYDTAGQNGWKVISHSPGPTIHFVYDSLEIIHNTTINDGNWHYMNVVSTGTTAWVVVDGGGPSAPISAPISSTAPFTIGMANDDSSPYGGYLDEIRIYKSINVGNLTDIQTTVWPSLPFIPKLTNTIVS